MSYTIANEAVIASASKFTEATDFTAPTSAEVADPTSGSTGTLTTKSRYVTICGKSAAGTFDAEVYARFNKAAAVDADFSWCLLETLSFDAVAEAQRVYIGAADAVFIKATNASGFSDYTTAKLVLLTENPS